VDKPYEKEAAFVHECLQKYSTGTSVRLLELACGTGSHALALEKFGYKIVATDYSEDLLSVARRKSDEVTSSVDFRWQDMCSMELTDESFDAAICLFDSIGYVETNEALMQVLQGVHRHLRPEGLFVFEFWHAAAMLRNYDPLRVRCWSTPQRELVRISETKIDCARQLARVTYTIYNLSHDGTYSRLEETQTNRYFLVREMEGWLSHCGFIPLKWFAGYTSEENITVDTWHILVVARKDESRTTFGMER